MWKLVQRFVGQWLRKQFRGNPLIEQPGPYLSQVGSALQVGMIAILVLIALGFFGSIIFVIGVLRGWF